MPDLSTKAWIVIWLIFGAAGGVCGHYGAKAVVESARADADRSHSQ